MPRANFATPNSNQNSISNKSGLTLAVQWANSPERAFGERVHRHQLFRKISIG